jgi:fermentation-respiration switch protein FrsA (DUF1100 family)
MRRRSPWALLLAGLTLMVSGCDRRPRPAWQEEAVRVVADSGTTLAGTLAYPARAREAPVGAVLLLGGSGAQDRDGTRLELPGYAPWRELSDVLVDSGLAVLRLDDRGTAQSTGQFAGATTEDFARDAQAALTWLRRHPMVNAARVAVVGHSEGAVVALLVARADPTLAALVLWGAPSRPGREIARWQREQLVMGNRARWPAEEQATVLATADAQADAMARHDPWLRTWFVLDPRAVARDVRVPVLLLHGETDQQVPPFQADELAQVLRGAGAAPVDVRHFRDTDHLLLADHDGDPQGYVRLAERRLRTAVLDATTHFLSIHTASR